MIEDLKNIKLQIGDKITFKSGSIQFVSDEREKCLGYYNTTLIVKIERYKRISGDGIFGILYNIETIYEAKEEPTNDDIEEIDIVQSGIDNYCIRSKTGQLCQLNRGSQIIANKLNEVIKKVNGKKK